MVSAVRTVLLATVLTCSCVIFTQGPALAQTENQKPPVPKEAPPRVPFSAFRMKPILDPQLDKKQGASSLVIQDMDQPYKPAGKVHVLKPKVAVQPGKVVPLQLPPGKTAEQAKGKAKIIPLQLPPQRAAEEKLRKEEVARERETAKENLPPHIEEVPAPDTKALSVTKLAKPIPMPKPVTLPEGQPPQKNEVSEIREPESKLFATPDPVPLQELVELDQLTAQIINGKPVPARKPGSREQIRDGGQGVVENILTSPSEGALPRPPVSEGTVNAENRGAQSAAEMQAQSIQPIIAAPKPVPSEELFVPVPQGGATERIRDRRRFGSQDRMGGEGSGLAGTQERDSRRLASLGLPADMRSLRIGKLDDAEGISPVLIPGNQIVAAAPDAPRMDKRGIPAEVIVFFQENSGEMEIGQMDVLASDVVAMMKNRPDLDLEIVGYAEPQAGGETETRKMSLARAIMVRDYLSKQRIADNRLTVKGEGDDTGIEPRDRVEMYFSR